MVIRSARSATGPVPDRHEGIGSCRQLPGPLAPEAFAVVARVSYRLGWSQPSKRQSLAAGAGFAQMRARERRCQAGNRGSGASDSTNADTDVGGAPLHGKAGKMDAYPQNHGPQEFGHRSRIGRLARSRGYGQAKRSPSRMTAGSGLSPRYCRLVGVDMTHWGCARCQTPRYAGRTS